MVRLLCVSLFVCAFNRCYGVSTKMDFETDDVPTAVETNLTKSDDQDVEVKHTIVVSTKLKNNNRRGLHSYNDGGAVPNYKTDFKEPKDDSGEVPIVNGYKSVESTLIRTPDTRRNKNQEGSQLFPDSIFINRNINDQYDIYPNYVNNPAQWRPSTQYNNINWLGQEVPTITEYNSGFINTLNSRPAYQTPRKFHRRITDDGMKEFYCKKCAELQGFRGCAQARSNSWTYTRETTTPRIKLDGKLAKLN